MTLNIEIRKVRLADCRPQAVNARFMTTAQLDRLTENIRRDGTLTSVPLLYQNPDDQGLDIVSGHHRIKAALAALGEDATADAMVVLDRQSLAEIRARQMSHNAVEGQDDLAVLRQMWDDIEDIDWREYVGLDDKTLDLLAKVDLASIGEANLDYLTTSIIFLPHEIDRARALFAAAAEKMRDDETWIAEYAEWDRLVDALESIRGAHNVKNTAAAFTVMLDVFEAHLDDLRAGYVTSDGLAKHTKSVPTEVAVGARHLPANSAAMIEQAVKEMRARGDIAPEAPVWKALDWLASHYLGSKVGGE